MIVVAALDGEIEIAGPELAGSLTELGLIDEYQLYLRPIVLGRGKPFFTGPRAPLHLVASDRIGENTIKLTYVSAWSQLAWRPTPTRQVRFGSIFGVGSLAETCPSDCRG